MYPGSKLLCSTLVMLVLMNIALVTVCPFHGPVQPNGLHEGEKKSRGTNLL